VGDRRATGIDRCSVPTDRPTPATTQQRAVYKVSRRQKIPHEVNRSPNDRYTPEFDKFKDAA
jgi:hypothetical protein